ERAAVPRAERPEPGEQRGHPQDAVDDGELDVVDVADGRVVDVDDLAVEQVQPEVEDARRGHWPAFVAIMSGIVTTDTTQSSTRNTVATPLVSRLFVRSPM